jgi:hypothetical protein
VSLITNEWRLKLGALALSLALLGAVAFSQVKTDHVIVSITYVNLPQNLIVLAPPRQIDVPVSAPAELFPLNKTSVTVIADMSRINVGTNQLVSFKVRASDVRIQVAVPPPINVDVDRLQQVQLNVQLLNARGAIGYAIDLTKSTAQCGNSTQPCAVTFSGPASLTDGLSAFVTITDPVAADTTDLLNQQVKFEQKGRPVDTTKIDTLPQITFDPQFVTAHVEAKRGSTSRQLVLIDAPPTRLPPTGYRITKVVIDPPLVLITGLGDAIGKAGDTITLDAVDLGGATSDKSFKVNITYPDGTTGAVKTATITYSISPNPTVNPTPGP